MIVRYFVNNIESEFVQALFRLALISIIDKCSLKVKDGNGLKFKKNYVPVPDIVKLYLDKVSEMLSDIKGTFNIIISLGHLNETPATLKKMLSADGRLVYALPEKDRIADFTKRLLKEAGFSEITTYRVSPDYLFTTEIYAEDYIGGGAGDYLLIAK